MSSASPYISSAASRRRAAACGLDVHAGGHELPVDEKRLTRARRAVEKAIDLLREPDDERYLDL